MVTSKIEPFKKPIEEPKRTPEEILRLESLLLDNGWKMLVERIESEISKSKDIVMKPRPVGLTKEQSDVRMDDMERIKSKIAAYNELLLLPYEMMKEYGDTEFRVSYTKDI